MISQALNGMRGKENSFEHGFERIRVFTWKPSFLFQKNSYIKTNAFLVVVKNVEKAKSAANPMLTLDAVIRREFFMIFGKVQLYIWL